MGIGLKGIIIIVGNYGSGKTEVAVNLAVNRRAAGLDVRIADLDLVNLYFRTREARKPLTDLGIDVVLPAPHYMNADLPVLSPAISGMIRNPSEVTILDAGGNDVGVTVLSSLFDILKDSRFRMLQVVNPFRPFTETLDGCISIRQSIEKASRLTIDGIIANPNLLDETGVEDVYSGYDFAWELSGVTGLPLELISIAEELLPGLDEGRFACPVLPVRRQMVPPWRKARKLRLQGA